MRPENLNAAWGESVTGERANARVGRRVHKKHLLHHHLGDGIDVRQPHLGELIGRGRAVGGKGVEDSDYVRIAGDNPGVEKWIPVDRIFLAEAAKQWIGIAKKRASSESLQQQAPTSYCPIRVAPELGVQSPQKDRRSLGHQTGYARAA